MTGLVVTDRLPRLARTAALRTFRTPRDTTSIVVSGADFRLSGARNMTPEGSSLRVSEHANTLQPHIGDAT